LHFDLLDRLLSLVIYDTLLLEVFDLELVSLALGHFPCSVPIRRFEKHVQLPGCRLRTQT
jgi:hypothetical protein